MFPKNDTGVICGRIKMGNKKGLCLFCERSDTCTYSKPKNGVIECNEYEETHEQNKNFKKETKDEWVIINFKNEHIREESAK